MKAIRWLLKLVLVMITLPLILAPCGVAGKVVCGISASLFDMDFLSAGQCATGNGGPFVLDAAVARGGSTSNADRWICDFYDTAGGW